MEAQVDLPGMGKVDRRWVYAGGALVLGIAGYAWWNARMASPVPVAGGAAPPATPDDGVYQNPAPSAPVAEPDAPAAPRTNPEWTQRVIEGLASLGFDPAFVATVIGKLFARARLTPEELDVVGTAIAMQGRPPEGSYTPVPAPAPTPAPAPAPAPKPTPAAWKGPLTRKAPGALLRSIKVPAGGRRTWAQVVHVMYANVPPDAARQARAGGQLRAANVWRGRADGSGRWETVGAGATISVPAALYV